MILSIMQQINHTNLNIYIVVYMHHILVGVIDSRVWSLKYIPFERKAP